MRMSKDALLCRVLLAGIVLVFTASFTTAATYRTPNFIITAPTPEIAEQCGKVAEHYRKTLAEDWLGEEMKRWYKPCTLTVKVGQIGAGGATTFAFDRGEVFGWRMNVQGSLERILDSVIPHEVSHTILASHFRRPLPRWADEGAATLIEHESERQRQALLLKQVWNTSQRIPLRKLLSIKEYPRDMQHVLTLYAEGYSLADFLVQAGGKTRYLEFLETSHRQGWDRAIEEHYSLAGVEELESRWNNWVMAGSPKLNIPKGAQLASNAAAKTSSRPSRGEFERPIIRGQSPEPNRAPAEERQVAAAPQNPPSPQPKTTVALPKASETRQESPGWRRMRRKLDEIPQDFVNPANDPAKLAIAREVQTAEAGPVSPFPNPGQAIGSPRSATKGAFAAARTPPQTSPAPPSQEPAFRFELGGGSEFENSPGGQAPGNGRAPNRSEFPRTRTARDPATLGQASERPFSP